MDDEKFYCRVCGLKFDEPPWGENDDAPGYDICECCGCEAGLDDTHYRGIQLYRTQWLETGANWFCPKEKPLDWDLFAQLKNIPEKYR